MTSPNYNKITVAEFDHALSDILDGMSGEAILQIPSVYSAIREELNDSALDLALAKFHTA